MPQVNLIVIETFSDYYESNIVLFSIYIDIMQSCW